MSVRLRRATAALALLITAAVYSAPVGQEPNDPYLHSAHSWKQSYGDQYAHQLIGLSGHPSAWDIEDGSSHPVVVAFIDTGIDYLHPDLARANLWINPHPGAQGYADDVMGWNFIDNNNNVWDNDGHGTFTAGIVAATINNGYGIAGVSRGVKIMPLKALNFLGRGSNSHIVGALVYAADHGARIVNISIEQTEQARSAALQWAVDYARGKGVLVVVAAGNQGRDTATISPSGLEHVLTVAGTDHADKRLDFSNWGKYIKLAAPGEEILSLRARKSDLLVMAGGKDYEPGRAFLGSRNEFYHATGTSFSAPFVTGVAALILAKNPALTPEQVEHMLLMSADDVEAPGWDPLTGYGRLNALKALQADPDWFIYAELHQLVTADDHGAHVVQVYGTAVSSSLDHYRVRLGLDGSDPSTWDTVIDVKGQAVNNGLLGSFPLSAIKSRGAWVAQLTVYDSAGKSRESRNALNVQ